jgi:DNA-binding MarR family transcriptional regulator
LDNKWNIYEEVTGMFMDKFTFIGNTVRRHSLALAKSLSMSEMEASACAFIHYHWETNQERIARVLGMDKGNAAKMMLSLENQGLVRRNVNPKNRREYIIELTDDGREKIGIIINAVEDWEREALSHLSAYEREVFIKAVDMMLQKCREVPFYSAAGK